PQEVVAVFNTADHVGNNRIVLNIAKNKYRLIVKFEFHPKAQLAFVRFVGTHKKYDDIKDIKNI
ncbi:MAG: type II toxin-antitoxin system HigB family toxin, partial [Saprospiraceae bacterium]